MAVGNAHLYAKCPVFIGDDTIRRFGMGVCCLASAHDSLTIGNHLNQQHLTRGDSEKRSAAIVSLSRAARVARSVSVRSAGASTTRPSVPSAAAAMPWLCPYGGRSVQRFEDSAFARFSWFRSSC